MAWQILTWCFAPSVLHFHQSIVDDIIIIIIIIIVIIIVNIIIILMDIKASLMESRRMRRVADESNKFLWAALPAGRGVLIRFPSLSSSSSSSSSLSYSSSSSSSVSLSKSLYDHLALSQLTTFAFSLSPKLFRFWLGPNLFPFSLGPKLVEFFHSAQNF